MDRYGRITEGPPSDLSLEWTAPVAETELEESYPERPLEADCIYYLRTGFCGYGSRCRFNHPRGHSAVGGSARPGGVEYPERLGQPLCQYFMKTGMCKFGATCKYHHPKQGGGPAIPATLNYYGYPLRPGEKECSYYIKTGQCKFGGTCKFHHPQPVSVHLPTQSQAPSISHVPSPSVYPSVQSPSLPSSQHYGVVVARPSMLPSSYIHSAYGPLLLPQGMVPFPSWGPYLTPLNPVASPSTQPSVGSGSLYGITQLSPSAPAYVGSYHTIPSVGPSSSSQREVFPERPGQPECQHYMRTGDCKFGSSCKYHHPPELIAPRANVVLGPMGLPLRPGAPQCTHFAQHGVCKFGPACKFDHSSGTLSYSPSASSLVDMPVAPYPVGSTIGTLAPSSSSSDLRPEIVSGSSKDSSYSARASSSLSISSGSTGSIMSRSGPFSQSSVVKPPSSQSSGPFTSSV